MKTFTITDIRSWEPCYDPSKYLPETWRGNALDILHMSEVPPVDKQWVVLRKGILSDKTLRLFAVGCACEALKLVSNPDLRSVTACDVAERFANGQATDDELDAAWDAAWAAAWDAARAATCEAARAAAWDAAWDAQILALIELIEKEVREDGLS